jgi:hypothetical protein
MGSDITLDELGFSKKKYIILKFFEMVKICYGQFGQGILLLIKILYN